MLGLVHLGFLGLLRLLAVGDQEEGGRPSERARAVR